MLMTERVEAASPSAAVPKAGPESAGIATKLPSLTGLRWLAAFLVFGFHVGTLDLIQTPSYHHKWDMVFGGGASGVSFFFVLSGFVLVWSARSDDTVFRFWRRRLAKIYPTHVVMWVVIIAVAALWWGDSIRHDYAVGGFFLLQPWINYKDFPYSINPVSWSLGCEAFFYLCFPLVLPLVKRSGVRLLYVLAGLMVVLIYGAALYRLRLPVHYQYWFVYMFPPVRSLEFWLGVFVGELVVRRRWNGPGLWVSTVIAVAVYTSVGDVGWFPIHAGHDWGAANLAAAFVLLIAGAAMADIGGEASPWRHPILVWLGEVSFAFYMVHVFLIQTVLRELGRPGRGWGVGSAVFVIPAFLGAALVLAWLLHRFVEMPMMRLLGPKRRRPAVAEESDSLSAARTDSQRPVGSEPEAVTPGGP